MFNFVFGKLNPAAVRNMLCVCGKKRCLWLIGGKQSVFALYKQYSPTFNFWVEQKQGAWIQQKWSTREEFLCVNVLLSSLIKATSMESRSLWNIEIHRLLYSTVHHPRVWGNNFNFSSWWASTHGQLSQHNRWYLGAQFCCCPQYGERQTEAEIRKESACKLLSAKAVWESSCSD